MQNLIFNSITFDWPIARQIFYFSLEENKKATRIHKSIFPKSFQKIFPHSNGPDTEYIYTTFTWEKEGFTPFEIDLKTENPDFVKRYFNSLINRYFRHQLQQVVKTGFVKENQIWLPIPDESNAQFHAFERFSLIAKLKEVSDFPELQLSYDGKTKVLKMNIVEAMKEIDPSNFNWVLYENQVVKYAKLMEWEGVDYEKVFPVLGKKLKFTLGISPEIPLRDNRYKRYLAKIESFRNQFLNTDLFRKIFHLNSVGFISVSANRINLTTQESNQLQFGNGKAIVPMSGMRDFGPFKKPLFSKIQLFFIVHSEEKGVALKLKDYLDNGLAHFKGLFKFSQVLCHTSDGFSIVFKDRSNPTDEIEEILTNRVFDPNTKYISIYLTPFSKFEADLQKKEVYYKVKEMLLKRNITSQCIDANKVLEQGDKFSFSLPNIAVAILAKLNGIPWQISTPQKNELIVGIGAFKQVAVDIQYIGSAFSFNNTGGFNRFEYFPGSEVKILAGSIARAVREFSSLHGKPDRLIIHFFKTMSDKELEPILLELENLELNVPVFILTINKTESEDVVVFDTSWNGLMPMSGTFVNIGQNRYLLCNNTRYSTDGFKDSEGFPFPIKLKIDCTDKAQLGETRIVKELIDQVYQFSRIYWKSVKQQNLPVTIKYPEMVAQIAPHFDGADIPEFGKDNLWFL